MPVTCNQDASSSNGEEEDTVATNGGGGEAQEGRGKAYGRFEGGWRKGGRVAPSVGSNEGYGRKAERGVAPLPTPSTQAFWIQPFSKEIDETTIPPNFHEVVIESFNGT
ncbi:hypothetical protein CR513_56179, partial [Mucuna pruriens]